MKKKLAQLILITALLVAAAILIVQTGKPGQDLDLTGQQFPGIQEVQSPVHQATQAARATATYGAQQFYLQLTAVAGDQ